MPFLQIDSDVVEASGDPGWTLTALRTLMLLNRQCAGPYGQVVATFRTEESIAEILKVSVRSVERAIAFLETAGEIDPHWRKGHTARWYTIMRRTTKMIQGGKPDSGVGVRKDRPTSVSRKPDESVGAQPDVAVGQVIGGDSGDGEERPGKSTKKELYVDRSLDPDTKGGEATESRATLMYRQQMIARARQVERERFPPEEAHIVVPPPGTWMAEHVPAGLIPKRKRDE